MVGSCATRSGGAFCHRDTAVFLAHLPLPGVLTGRRRRGFRLLEFHGVSGRALLLALVISAIHTQVFEPASGIEDAGLLKN